MESLVILFIFKKYVHVEIKENTLKHKSILGINCRMAEICNTTKFPGSADFRPHSIKASQWLFRSSTDDRSKPE